MPRAYTSFLSWQDISSSDIHLMAATPCSGPLSDRGGETSLLVALAGGKQCKLFICALPKLCWTATQQEIMDNVTRCVDTEIFDEGTVN